MADNENRYMKNFLHALLFSFVLIDIGNASSLLDVYQEAIINDPRIKEAFANKEAIIEAKPQARSFILPM